MKVSISILAVLCLAGCSVMEDAATSVAYDLERGVRQLGSKEGSTHIVVHDAKARAGADVRSLTVQFDKVGALIVWYKDEAGTVIESGSTSYHSRFVDSPETIIVDAQIESPLSIELHRRNGRAVVGRVF